MKYLYSPWSSRSCLNQLTLKTRDSFSWIKSMDEGPGRQKKSFIMSVRETKTIFIFMRSLKSHFKSIGLCIFNTVRKWKPRSSQWHSLKNNHKPIWDWSDFKRYNGRLGSENMKDVYFLQTLMSKQEVLLLELILF